MADDNIDRHDSALESSNSHIEKVSQPSNAASSEGLYRVTTARPKKYRSYVVLALGEFVGTFLFLFFAFAGTQVANSTSAAPTASTLLYISLAFGFSLTVNVWAFYRISGGLFNPAVTFGLALVGAMSVLRAAICFVMQILGAIAAAGIVSALYPGYFNVATTLHSTSVTRGLFIEMFLTAELVFAILMLAVEKHRATFLAPVGIGLAFFIAELAGVAYTGGSLNPARSLGPCIMLANFPGYHWIYWVGPGLGAMLAAGMYKFVRLLEYELYGATDQDEDHCHALEMDMQYGPRKTPDSAGSFSAGPSVEAAEQNRNNG